MINVEEFISLMEEKEENKVFKLATVTDLFASGKAKIKFDGEDIASLKEYSNLSSYAAAKNDRVLLAIVGGTYLILGKVV